MRSWEYNARVRMTCEMGVNSLRGRPDARGQCLTPRRQSPRLQCVHPPIPVQTAPTPLIGTPPAINRGLREAFGAKSTFLPCACRWSFHQRSSFLRGRNAHRDCCGCAARSSALVGRLLHICDGGQWRSRHSPCHEDECSACKLGRRRA